jgi:hypothetical protein
VYPNLVILPRPIPLSTQLSAISLCYGSSRRWSETGSRRGAGPSATYHPCSPPEPIVYVLCAVPITLSLPVVTTQITVSPVKNVKNALLAGKSRGKSGSKSRDIQARYSRRVIHVAKKLCGTICKSISRLPCNTVLMTMPVDISSSQDMS